MAEENKTEKNGDSLTDALSEAALQENDDETSGGKDVVKKKKKWGIPVMILAITFVFMVLPAAVLIFSFTFAVPKKHLRDKIKAADKYITQLDYEKAILAYKEAIEMDPKSVAAYLGIADAYEGLANRYMDEIKVGDANSTVSQGISYLENGYDVTKSKEIEDRLTELRLKKEYIALKPVNPEDCPNGIRAFLNNFCWNGAEEFRGETEDELRSVANNSFHLSFFCDYSVYPEGPVELGEEWQNPRVLDADGFDWIMENVYNFDADLVKKLRDEDFQNKESAYGMETWSYDAANNTYNTFWGGVGDGPFVMIKHVEKSKNIYLVEYDVYICFQEEFEPDETRYAILEEKTANGNQYWSIHYDGKNPDFGFAHINSEEENAGNTGAKEYSEDEICQMAVSYYNTHLSYQPVAPYMGTVVKNENHMITVCIYQEGYSAVNYRNTPTAWFYISSYTGRGHSTEFGYVDLE